MICASAGGVNAPVTISAILPSRMTTDALLANAPRTPSMRLALMIAMGRGGATGCASADELTSANDRLSANQSVSANDVMPGPGAVADGLARNMGGLREVNHIR